MNISDWNDTSVVEEGRSHSLFCVSRGCPKPTVLWYKVGDGNLAEAIASGSYYANATEASVLNLLITIMLSIHIED